MSAVSCSARVNISPRCCDLVAALRHPGDNGQDRSMVTRYPIEHM
jgi:hypothetical protein